MGNEEFIKKAKEAVRRYIEEHIDKKDKIPIFDLYVVWNAYILGNIKCLISSTIPDGMYYEVTYNSSRNEIYLDAYKKFENRCIKVVEE